MIRVATFAAALAAAAPALAQTVTIETARGPADLAVAPETIAVYDLAAADTLDALGVQADGLPDRVYVDYLDASAAEPVGTLFEPDLEALNAIQPDLVIVGGRSAAQFDAVSQVAPAIDMTLDGTSLVDQGLARLDAYGKLFAKEAEAEALAATFDDKLSALREMTDGAGTALIVMTNGPKVSAYGAGSRFGWLHDLTGLAEAAEGMDAASHGEAISFEFIRDANPDWLIVVDRAAAIGDEGAGAAQTLDNALVAETTAWKEGQVIYLNSAEAYITAGGIQSMTNALDTLTEALSDADS